MKHFTAFALRASSIAFLLLGLCAKPLTSATAIEEAIIFRVAVTGADSGDCGDMWTNPCDLQYALSLAGNGDELWVQQGIYTPTADSNQTVSFVLREGVGVFGGFEGDENARDERDYATYVTTLSGEIGEEGVTSDNSYHVVSAPTGVGNSAVLDGFTVTGGNASALNDANSNGGGIYIYQASPTLTNLVITDNAASMNGGGVYNYQGDPQLSYLTITFNLALHGGGMHSFQGLPDLEFVNFVTNSASASATSPGLGGGMYNYDSDASLYFVAFSNNSAAASASQLGHGGGMYNDTSEPTLTDVTFNDNSTLVFSAGDANTGGGMSNQDSSPLLTRVTFTGNDSTTGAGMMNVGGTPTLTDVTFNTNSATSDGGGMLNQGSAAILTDVRFVSNLGYDGAGMHNTNGSPTLTDVTFELNQASGYGGGMYNEGNAGTANPVFNGVTFDSNSAVFAGGLANEASGGGTASPTLTNVTFSGNTSTSNAGGMSITTSGSGATASPSLTHVTFSLNSANNGAGGGSGGAIWAMQSSGSSISVPIWNSIFWGDVAGTGLSVKEFQVYGGQLFQIRHSIIEQGCQTWFADCATGDLDPNGGNLASNPNLIALTDNGGLTETMALPADSVAVDAADGNYCPSTDQRGVTRPQPDGGACDMGAFEYSAIGPLCYVNANATGANSGVSWADGFTDLQSALQASACEQVAVAAGTYVPGTSESDSFVIRAGVEVIGGFDGFDDAWGDQNPDLYYTTLDGNLASGGNSTHVVTISGPVDTSTVLDGFFIVGGNADGEAPADRGGGLYCNGSGDGNTCNPGLYHLAFNGNSANGNGAGLYLDASDGGTASPTMNMVGFTSNYAGMTGGGLYAIATGGGTSSPSLSNVTFSGNGAVLYGGGAAFVANGGNSEPILSKVDFSSNSAADGGGLYLYSNGGTDTNIDVKMTHGWFLDNMAGSSDGGAIYQHVVGPDGNGAGSSLMLVNTILAGNQAAENGGAIYLEAELDGVTTDPPVWEDPKGYLRIIASSTYGNEASGGHGGAVYATAEQGTTANVTISSSILWGDTDVADAAEVHIMPGVTAGISYSDIQGGCEPTGADCTLDHNVSSDPFYASPESGALQLLRSSPAIDAGDNWDIPDGVTTDLAGEPRFADVLGEPDTGSGDPPVVDMGAYEYQVTCPTGPVVYVDQDAIGTRTGDSWTNAFQDLAPALQLAPDCPGAREYWVSEGVYIPGTFDASDTFHIDGGTKVYGGFNGTGDGLEDRDPQRNVTILSGDIDGDDDSIEPDGNHIAENAGEIVGENPYHVVTIDGGETVANVFNTVLDGFTITGGYATGIGTDAYGGGLYCFGRSDALCSPTLENLVFSGNYATEGGGGLANDGQGGASNPVINNVTFTGNWAGTLHTPVLGGGGAIINFGEANGEGIGASNPTITNSTFYANKAARYGGALYNDGTHNGESSPVVVNSTFVGNESAHYAGAVLNHAWVNGETAPTYINVTFSANTATNGGGNMATDGAEGGYAAVTMNNSIVWGGAATYGPQISTSNGTLWISNSAIQDAFNDSGTWIVSAIDSGGNTEEDPLLGPLANNGGTTRTMALLANSSAIDAGDALVCAADPVDGLDQRGITRPHGAGCDMGAFERLVPTTEFDLDYKTEPAKFISDSGMLWWLEPENGDWTGADMGPDVASYVARSDFDGDGITDPTKYVSSGSLWYLLSDSQDWQGKYIGADGNVLAGTDFDGDNITDPAKYVGSAGAIWYLESGTGLWKGTYIGADAAQVLAGSDYDGDDKADLAKYVASAGAIWYRASSTGAWQGIYIGSDGTPVAASDFDGDGKTDPAKYVASAQALWYRESSTGAWKGVYLGSGAINYIAASDFDGDGKTDPAKFLTSAGALWYRGSATSSWKGIYMGTGTYQIVN